MIMENDDSEISQTLYLVEVIINNAPRPEKPYSLSGYLEMFYWITTSGQNCDKVHAPLKRFSPTTRKTLALSNDVREKLDVHLSTLRFPFPALLHTRLQAYNILEKMTVNKESTI